ncbi:MAG: hypothetical protein WC073_08545 [Sterolibacterium sp.]
MNIAPPDAPDTHASPKLLDQVRIRVKLAAYSPKSNMSNGLFSFARKGTAPDGLGVARAVHCCMWIYPEDAQVKEYSEVAPMGSGFYSLASGVACAGEVRHA